MPNHTGIKHKLTHPAVSIHYHWQGCETRLLKVERDTHRNAHTHVLSMLSWTHPQIQADNENNKQRQLFKSVWQLKTTSVYFYLGIWHRWNFILHFCQIFWPCKDVLLFRKIYFCHLILIKSFWIFVVFSHLIVWRRNVRILCGCPVAMLPVTIWYLRLPVLLFAVHCLGHT